MSAPVPMVVIPVDVPGGPWKAKPWAPLLISDRVAKVTALPSTVPPATYRLRSVAEEPPYRSLRKLTDTVCWPGAKAPFTSSSCVAPAAWEAAAVRVPPICLPSMLTVNCASPW